jgi:protein TonB
MAYVDTAGRTRINPLGVATAIGMNALFLFGIASIAPNAGALEGYDDTNVTAYVPEKIETTPKVPDKPVERQIAKAPDISTPLTQTFVPPVTPVDLTDLIIPQTPPFVPTPPFVEVKLTPPQPLPVLISARYDSRYASAQQPEYPIDMARAEIEGSAIVKVRIGTDGRVLEVVNISTDNPSFFEATRKQALSKWRFKPATRDGVAVESWREMKVRFQMPNRFS